MRSPILQIVLILVFASSLWSQNVCDPNIIGAGSEELKYQSRSEVRCEGFYEEQSGGGIILAGFLYGKFDYKQDPEEELELSIEFQSDQDVYVRSIVFPLRTYFRMDGRIQPHEQTFTWPMGEVLVKSQVLDAEDLSVYGFIRYQDNLRYIPLRVQPKLATIDQDSTLRIYFKSVTDISDIRYLIDFGNNGNSGWISPFITGADAGDRIEITLPDLSAGEYKLRVSAKNKYSGRIIYSEYLPLLIH